MIATVYRPVFTWKGDFEGDLEDYLIGTVTGVVIGGQGSRSANPSVQALRDFPGVVSTESMVGIPWALDSGIVVQQRDRLVIDNRLYAVTGHREWTGENVLTGTQPSYYWVEVENT